MPGYTTSERSTWSNGWADESHTCRFLGSNMRCAFKSSGGDSEFLQQHRHKPARLGGRIGIGFFDVSEVRLAPLGSAWVSKVQWGGVCSAEKRCGLPQVPWTRPGNADADGRLRISQTCPFIPPSVVPGSKNAMISQPAWASRP
jgi:hypothetical protein